MCKNKSDYVKITGLPLMDNSLMLQTIQYGICMQYHTYDNYNGGIC